MKIRNVGGLWAQLVGLCVYSCSNICGWIKKTPLATVSCIRHVWVCQISLWCLKWQSSSLVPRPRPAFRRLHAVWKSGRGPGIFSHEWHRDRKDGRKGLIVRGQKEPRYQVNYHMYPASGTVVHTKHWVCSQLNNTQNAACIFCKFLPFSDYIISREKRYQALPAFPDTESWAGPGYQVSKVEHLY